DLTGAPPSAADRALTVPPHLSRCSRQRGCPLIRRIRSLPSCADRDEPGAVPADAGGAWCGPGWRAMTIVVHQRPLEETRSANESRKWLGDMIVNARTYRATSRMAPANDIARQLVADAIQDAPMQVYTTGL